MSTLGQAASTAPANDAFAIAPDDANDLAIPARSLYIGGSGNVTVITSNGTTVAFVGLAAGTLLPVRVNRVKSTGTTATNIVGLI